MESLIPFGCEATTRKLADVSSVPRGSACNCICPSCKAPLVAKQGKQKEWHFAHAVRHAEEHDVRICKYSFAVSVRLMLLQLAAESLRVRTPEFIIRRSAKCPITGTEKQVEIQITKTNLVVLEQPEIEAPFSGVNVDILGHINNYPFVVYLSHKGRPVPERIRNPTPKESGCMVIYLDNLKQYMLQEKKGRYSHVLREFVANYSAERSWLFHPRENAGVEILNQKLQLWLAEQEKEYYRGQESSDYTCAMCRSKWSGYSRECKSCGTHLYTSEHKRNE